MAQLEHLWESVGAGDSFTKNAGSASKKPTLEEGGRELRTVEELGQVPSLLSQQCKVYTSCAIKQSFEGFEASHNEASKLKYLH